MIDRQSPFASSLFSFVASNLAPHQNPVTCILAGLDQPLAVCTEAERIEGDIVIIRPGVEHWVEINGSAKVLYFDGLEFPLTAALAARVPREVATLAIDALAARSGAQEELRARSTRCGSMGASTDGRRLGDVLCRRDRRRNLRWPKVSR
jgi:hypothetical protein